MTESIFNITLGLCPRYHTPLPGDHPTWPWRSDLHTDLARQQWTWLQSLLVPTGHHHSWSQHQGEVKFSGNMIPMIYWTTIKNVFNFEGRFFINFANKRPCDFLVFFILICNILLYLSSYLLHVCIYLYISIIFCMYFFVCDRSLDLFDRFWPVFDRYTLLVFPYVCHKFYHHSKILCRFFI